MLQISDLILESRQRIGNRLGLNQYAKQITTVYKGITIAATSRLHAQY